MGNSASKYFVKTISRITALVSAMTILIVVALVFTLIDLNEPGPYVTTRHQDKDTGQQALIKSESWSPPDTSLLDLLPDGNLIEYGRKLIANTSWYLGPRGTVGIFSNGMNCQNCHLEAGTKIFGNNYSAVASTYPKFRARSGTKETIEKRVNDCFERSLNGQPLPDHSREMKAIVAYIKWLGKDVETGHSPKGSGLAVLNHLDRPADPAKGKELYANICSACHGKSGEGLLNESRAGYKYPPLWGDNSYNWGAGLYRLSNFARFIKANMPLGATYADPVLTDEQSWDIAAYVNSRPRPKMNLSKDWPDISKKPFDHPFGPYMDSFPETQHKFGPFGPILENKR